MAFKTPYGSHNYLGSFADDTSALNFIKAVQFDSTKDGNGNPEEGMWYSNTTSHLARYYDGTSWGDMGGGGTGDVVGPSSATNEAIARFDAATGKLIQNSLVIIGDDGYVNIPSGQHYKVNGVDLSATDVGAEPTLTKGNLTELNSGILSIGNGTSSVIGSGTSIHVQKASASQDGYIGKNDWTTFNNKQNALTPGTISSGTTSAITIGSGTSSTVGPNVTVSINKASSSVDGYLGKDNWTTFNNKENALTFQYSVTRSVNTINLVGDSATPGNTKFYGTNGSGTRGWYDFSLPPAGSDGQVQYNNGGALGGAASFYYDDSTGFVGIGVAAPGVNLHVVNNTQSRGAFVTYHDTNSSQFDLLRARGTSSSPTNLTSGSILGTIAFRGWLGGGQNSSNIKSIATENWTSTAGSCLTFETTANGSVAQVERMRINSDGNVGIGTTAPGVMLDVVANTYNHIRCMAFGACYPTMSVNRGNGTAASITAVTSGNILGIYQFAGFYNTTTGAVGAQIYSIATENWSASAQGNDIVFLNIKSTTTTLSEKMRLTNAGVLSIGLASGTTGQINLVGTTSGIVSVKVADAAGTWTMTLPANAGTNTYLLSTNGSGVTSWVAPSGAPAGANSSLQYNNGGAFAGSSYGYNISDGIAVAGNIATRVLGRAFSDTNANCSRFDFERAMGTIASPTALANGAYLGEIRFTGMYTSGPADGVGAYIVAIADGAWSPAAIKAHLVFGTNGSTTVPERMRITSSGILQVGLLGALGGVGGQINLVGVTSGTVAINVAAAAGSWTMTLPTSGGTNGYFLQTNGSGVTTWAEATGSGGTPGGSDHQIQYNNGGAFGGTSTLYWDHANSRLGLGCSDPNQILEVSANASMYPTFSSFGTAVSPNLILQSGVGTRSASTPITANNILGTLSFAGVYQNNTPSGYVGAYIQGYAAEDWSASATGAYMSFFTTAKTTTSRVERLRILDSGYVRVGVTTDTNVGADFAVVQNNLNGTICVSSYGSGVNSYFYTTRARGTSGTPTAVADTDILSRFLVYGRANNAWQTCTEIQSFVDGTVSGASVPSRMSFYTMNASGTFAERMRITPSGILQIGLASGLTGQINLLGTTSGVVSVKVADTAGTWTMTLPDAVPASNGYVLSATTGGVCSWVASATGSGDVVGPSSATNEGVARFDTTTGKLIQNSLVIIGDDGYVNIPSGQKYKINGVNLSATDVGAEPTLTKYNLSETASGVLTITGGPSSVVTNAVTIQVKKASASQDGYLGKDDFAAFSSGGHVPVTLNSSAITGGLSLSTQEISFRAATNSVDGYLKHDDWITFNSKLSNPMTANGDLITQIGGVVDNLAIGSAGQVLTVSSGLPSWETPNPGAQISQLNTAAYVRDTGADGYFAVVTEGSERLRVDNTGKVGIGVEVPTSMLDVAGDVEVGSSNWMYYGDPTSNGSWRTGVVDGEFTVQKRESGLWETKGTFA